MSNNLSKRRKRLLRESRLHRIREAHRIKRLGVAYNPNKGVDTHTPLINKKFTTIEPIRGKRILVFPCYMNFREELEETLKFFADLKHEIIYGHHTEVFLDQSKLEEITPEVAIILFAELQRCLEYKSTGKRVRGNYPNSTDVARILTDIGFYSSLNIKSPPNINEDSGRSFFKIIPGNKTDARIADKLVKHFEKVITFNSIARKRLLAALIECMDNVHNHAYRDDKDSPNLIGEWWMAGFVDKYIGQVAFIFFDQGVGVPTTLREKWLVRIKRLVGMNDGELIQHAVLKGITRRNSDRHGNGFPSFKEFINEVSDEAGGFLRVISNNGDYSYCKHTKTKPSQLSNALLGSLMIWSLQPEKEIVDVNGHIDLSGRNQQMRLNYEH